MNNRETNLEGWSNINVEVQNQMQTDPTLRSQASGLLPLINGRVERCLLRMEMANNVYVVQSCCHHLRGCRGYVGFCSVYPQNMLILRNILNMGNDSKLIVIFEVISLIYFIQPS